MAVYEYAEKFEKELQKKYVRELTSLSLEKSNPGVKFINAQTIKLPTLTVSGYKDHVRGNAGGYNSGTIGNDWIPKKLEHDRDIEFVIDPMDIDEANLTLEMANITNTFEEEQAIPEKDSYRYSKLYSEAVSMASNGAVVDTTKVTVTNFLGWFDSRMEYMDDKGVPSEGRELRLTSAMYKIAKSCEGISRSINANGSNDGKINRKIYDIDDVTLIKVPSSRFMTEYNFTDGCVPTSGAKQINMMLCHPSCQVTRQKYSYIKAFTPGTDSRTADNYLYQNRAFGDSFLLEPKACGIAFNVEA